jgi:hypothetical protein
VKFRPIVLTAAAAIVFAACSTAGSTNAPSAVSPSVAPSSDPMSMAPPMSMEPSGSATTGGVVTDSAAADLRTKLNLALGEHIIFASKATVPPSAAATPSSPPTVTCSTRTAPTSAP